MMHFGQLNSDTNVLQRTIKRVLTNQYVIVRRLCVYGTQANDKLQPHAQ